MLNLDGNILVMYSSRINDQLPQVFRQTFNDTKTQFNEENAGILVVDTGNKKFKLVDIDSVRTFRSSDFNGYNKIFIVNINYINQTVVFELLVPLVLNEIHANTVGEQNISKIKDLFTNIKY